MMEYKEIAPDPNHLPPRPAFLRHPPDAGDLSGDQFAGVLLQQGEPIVVGGLSLIGPEQIVVPIVSVMHLQYERGTFTCNTIAIGHPTRALGFEFIDARNTEYSANEFIPNTIVYFVGLTNACLTLQDADHEALCAIARFVLHFVSDDGPPPAIDW